MYLRSMAILAIVVGAIAFWGCGETGNGTRTAAQQDRPDQMDTTKTEATRGAPYAAAKLEPTAGNEAHGTVTFFPQDDMTMIAVGVEGLETGPHGFHVHEFGDCSAPDGSSAGGHFAPLGSPHGPLDAGQGERHIGDLGNIVANAEGVVEQELADSVIRLDGENSIVGKAIIVHAGADDFTTQPSGAAGERVACGVIELWENEPGN